MGKKASFEAWQALRNPANRSRFPAVNVTNSPAAVLASRIPASSKASRMAPTQ
jgi:hypothetical protein